MFYRIKVKTSKISVCRRTVIHVVKSSSPTTPSTTVVPVERVSVTRVPQKPGRSRRGAGASHQSASATPVSATAAFQPVTFKVAFEWFSESVWVPDVTCPCFLCCRVAGCCLRGRGRHPYSQEGWGGCSEHIWCCCWSHRHTSRWALDLHYLVLWQRYVYSIVYDRCNACKRLG